MTDLTIAQRLAEKISTVNESNITPAAMRWAALASLDTIGCSLLGSIEPCSTILLDTPGIAESAGPALLLGTARRTSMLDASLFNATAAHALDYDDVSGVVGGHPSAPMVAPLFAIAESQGLGGKDFLVSFMVGIEVQHCIGRGVNFYHYGKGWHPTATLGIFGTAAATAHLLRLNACQTATALSIAASFAAGIKANFGTMTKPLHVGHCARDGLFAALLAQRGYTANPAAFEHGQGFLEVFNGAGNYDIDKMFGEITAPIDVDPDLGIKQFPCCGSTHPAVTMMLQLMREEGVIAEHVRKIEILAHRRRLPHTNNPNPQTGLEAKFSIQYATARALATGTVRLEHFEDAAIFEPRVRDLIAITETSIHPDMPDDSPNEFGSEVFVTLADGRRLSRRIDQLVGRGPLNPMSDEELYEKFKDCSSRVLSDRQIDVVFDQLLNMVKVSNLNHIARHLEVR
jgi:2-methylcitrate dehydratase PrpD